MAGRGALHYQGAHPGFFNNSHHVSVCNSTMVMVDGNYSCPDENYMIESLSQHTITGAEFDSAARSPPPSCHPGTRADISARMTSWMTGGHQPKRLLWLQGPAGVGKSAIIQTLAESECESTTLMLGATLFFSRPSGRDDPQKVFLTLAYQLAVQYAPYRRYVAELFKKDPKLIDKSMTEQFRRLIVKAFVGEKLLEDCHETVLVLIDGLDECRGEWAQREIVLLIGKFALQYPTVPIIWAIASRPEPHIRVAFTSVSEVFVEVEVAVNSAQARLDVERYLRDEFALIREKYPTSFPSSLKQWPTEAQFAKIVSRASGLFIFASTIVRFVDDLAYGNPVSQLQKVLEILDSGPQSGPLVLGPFAVLDALYTEIMTSVPDEILPIAKNMLTFVLPIMINRPPFAMICNWLGLSQAEAYGALRKLYAVLKIPPPEAENNDLRVFHKSFVDFLASRSRAGPFWIDELEARRLILRSSLRVLKDSHNRAESAVQISRIPLSWPVESQIRDDLFWSSLYQVLVVRRDDLDEGSWDTFKETAPFFDDLDFGIIESTFDPITTWDLLDAYHQSVFFSHLLRRKALQVIPASALDVDCINLNKLRIVCVAKNTCEIDSASITTGSSGKPLPEVMMALKEFWKYLTLTKNSTYNTTATLPAWGDDLDWKTFISDCILAALRSSPSRPAVLYGKADRRWVLIQIEFLEDNWLCFAPYRQN